jgi:NAD(P)-dependent dehydrogenase (short-subunit alcohol dehydrogenase family)
VGILESTEEEFDKVIAVTLRGPYLVSKYVAAQMVKQGRGGRIVNFASTSGLLGRPDAIAYAAAKGGVVNLTRAMAVQLASYKIRVNCVTPNRSGSPVGMDDTEVVGRQFKNLAGRLGTPEDQARAALFLVSDDSDFVYGANLIVDGGVMAAADFPKEQKISRP